MRDKRAVGVYYRMIVDFTDWYARFGERFTTKDQDTIAEEIQELLRNHGYDIEVTFIDVRNRKADGTYE